MTPESAGSAWGIVSSIATGLLAIGVMKGRAERLERDLDEMRAQMRSSEEKFVTLKHFEGVIGPIQKRIEEVSQDLKEVLRIARSRWRED